MSAEPQSHSTEGLRGFGGFLPTPVMLQSFGSWFSPSSGLLLVNIPKLSLLLLCRGLSVGGAGQHQGKLGWAAGE